MLDQPQQKGLGCSHRIPALTDCKYAYWTPGLTVSTHLGNTPDDERGYEPRQEYSLNLPRYVDTVYLNLGTITTVP